MRAIIRLALGMTLLGCAPLLAADPTDEQLKSPAWWLAQAEVHARQIENREQKAEVLAAIGAGYAEVGDKVSFKRMVLQAMLNGSSAFGAQKGIIMAGLAEAYASAGELDQAQRMEEYLDDPYDHQQVRQRIAAVLARNKDAGWTKAVDRALENLQKLPKSEHDQVHAYMAMICAGAGDFAKAEGLLAKVKEPAPRTDAQAMLIESKVYHGKLAAAEAVKMLALLEAELTKAPLKEADLAWMSIGSAYGEAGRVDLAKPVLPRIKFAGTQSSVWCRIAAAHHKAGQADAAAKAVAEAEALLKNVKDDDAGAGDAPYLRSWMMENIARTRINLGAGKAVWEWTKKVDTTAGKALACRGAAEALLEVEREKKQKK